MKSFLLWYLLFINLWTFLAFAVDKVKARKNRWRIPETRLLLFAVIGGSVGALAGMTLFRHKTRHLKFRAGIPVILIAQILLAVLIHIFL